MVLEQMQPLVVSGLLMVEGGGRLRASCTSGSGCGSTHFFPHCVSGRWLLLVLLRQGRLNSPKKWRSYRKSWMKR